MKTHIQSIHRKIVEPDLHDVDMDSNERIEVKENLSETEAKSDQVTDEKGGSIYKCDRCSKNYKRKSALKNHIRSKHCNYCSFVTYNTYLLMEHKRLKHTTKKRTSAFKKIHMRKMHETIEPDFHEVDIKNITKNENIEPMTIAFSEDCNEVKVKTVTDPKDAIRKEKKKYVCDQCSKRYRNKGHLYLHVQNCHKYVSNKD